jgi:hypothetical protein
MILQSLAGQVVVDPVSPYTAVNYLLFRVYEAAKQLAGVKEGRRGAVVVNEVTWWRFAVQLRNEWIDWTNPRFLGGEPDWKQFLVMQQRTYAELPTDLCPTLSKNDAVWIVRQLEDYEYRLEHEMALPRSASQGHGADGAESAPRLMPRPLAGQMPLTTAQSPERQRKVI